MCKDDKNILILKIHDALDALSFTEKLYREKHPVNARKAFYPFNELYLWGSNPNDSIGVLKLMVEFCHDHADKQEYYLRELMFAVIDRIRNIINGKPITTERFGLTKEDCEDV